MRTRDGREVEALLVDLDGTVYHGGRPIVGAAEALAALRRAGVPFRFATNTTRRPRAAIAAGLGGMGIRAAPEDVFSAPAAAARWLRERGVRRVFALLAEATLDELAGFELTEERPEQVLVGDLGEAWTYDLLDRAFQALVRGAGLVAVQKNRYWDTGEGIHLDAGPFVAALEYAADLEATVVGKPSRPFFEAAAAGLGAPMDRVAVVGDTVHGDVAGAQAAGALGVLVRTGAYREDLVQRSGVRPDATLASVAELPAWLGIDA